MLPRQSKKISVLVSGNMYSKLDAISCPRRAKHQHYPNTSHSQNHSHNGDTCFGFFPEISMDSIGGIQKDRVRQHSAHGQPRLMPVQTLLSILHPFFDSPTQ